MTSTTYTSAARRPLVAIALLFGLLFTPAAASADQDPLVAGDFPGNGEVLIGAPAEGPSLVRSRIPTRPLLVTIDSPYEIFGNTGTLIHVAAWTADGHPARAADVYFGDELVGRTDETGTLVFRWGVRDDGAAAWRRGGMVSVRWEQAGLLYGGDVSFDANPRTGSFASDHLFVYTDRGVYNPGDAIRIRAIGWHLAADYTPLDGAEVELTLRAPNGRVVSASAATTDDFGVTALELPTAPHFEEGVYTLSAAYEDASAEARLRIEHYTPPVIDIQHTLGRFLTLDQSDLSFEVTLGTFTGAAFEHGELDVNVLVEGASRYLASQAVEGPGPHNVTIEREALVAIRRGLRERDLVEVELAVTDAFGRRDEVTRELRFFRNPYIVVIEKDRDFYSPGDPVELIVRVSDRDRVPVRNTEITVVPSIGSGQTVTTDDQGLAQVSLEMPASELSVQVLLADVGSPVATSRLPLLGAQPMRSHIAEAVVREGDSTRIVVHFPSHFIPAESVVHMDMVDTSGALVAAELLPIRATDDGWVAEADVRPPSWGSMLLTFFCLGRDTTETGSLPLGRTFLGLMTEGQNLAVYPGRELTITLDGVPDEVAPGATFAGDVRVTDLAGNPVDASVGAALVDMAVISLKDPLEITPMDHFYNPRLRVLSTTGSAILTWPVVSRNWGSDRRDVALPPFPFRSGGTVDGVFDGARKVHFGENTDADIPVEDEQAWAPHGDAFSAVGEYGAMRLPEELAEAPIVTIRTEFPDTSVWEPALRAPGGAGRLTARVPDAITTQQLTLVASDRNGGVGVLRVPVRVSQELFVQTDLPDALYVGDTVTASVVVENHGDTDETVEVSLAGEPLGIDGDPVTLDVPAGGAAVAEIEVTAERAGPVSLVATADSGERHDVEERVVFVHPVGLPDLGIETLTLSAGEPAVFEVELPDEGQLASASLNVAFPAVSAGFAGLEAIRAELRGADAWSTCGEILSVAALYAFQKDEGVDPVRLTSLRRDLELGLAWVLGAQRPDGGWGTRWDVASQPYITAYALEALTALEETGLRVPRDVFRRAVSYLETAQTEGIWDTSAVAFWEGDTVTVRLGLSAEIFSTVARLPASAHDPAWRRVIERSAPVFDDYLDVASPDPLTFSHAIIGLRAAENEAVVDVDVDRLYDAAESLWHLRDEGYWEPSWFNAYGGTIETTVAALEVYAEMGADDRLAQEQRDAVRYLLSTRDEWGGWHNPWGTAAAIRGLTLLDLEAERPGATVSVRVDGREVRRVILDADDPFLSVGELRELDLTPWLRPGETHEVEVTYDGALEPDVRLTSRHWREPEALVGRLLRLEAALSDTRVGRDDLVGYELRLVSDASATRGVQVDVAAPANTEIDESSLSGLVERGLIEAYEQTETGWRLSLALEAHESRELGLLLVARRSGEAVVPVAVAQLLGAGGEAGDGLAVAVAGESLLVE